MTKVLERLHSEAGRDVREQASSRIASLSRVPTRENSGTVRLTRTGEQSDGKTEPRSSGQ